MKRGKGLVRGVCQKISTRNEIKPDFPPRLLLSNSLSCDGPAWGSKPSGRVSGSSRGEDSCFAIEVLLTGLEFRDDAPLMWSSWAVQEESALS